MILKIKGAKSGDWYYNTINNFVVSSISFLGTEYLTKDEDGTINFNFDSEKFKNDLLNNEYCAREIIDTAIDNALGDMQSRNATPCFPLGFPFVDWKTMYKMIITFDGKNNQVYIISTEAYLMGDNGNTIEKL